MRFKLIDCCPVPAPLYPILLRLKKDTGAVYQSIYRGTDAEALLRKCGKHDQAWLYAHLPAGEANPPGRSTHELRSDGKPYPGPIGRKLKWWQVGIDVDNGHIAAMISDAARRYGWQLWRPYGAGVEYHHLNFRRRPARWRLFVQRPKRGRKR